MKIKIIFDSKAQDNKLKTGWGFSCLINDEILFDTGDSHGSLFFNMQYMGIKVSDIKKVIISHDHWDHTGGLWGLLERNKNMKIYSCPGFTNKFKNKVQFNKGELIETEDFAKIEENIYLTGEIIGMYKSEEIAEQSLILKSSKGLTLITGCAHPGIINIIKKVKDKMDEKINLVLGGFHLYNSSKKEIISVIDDFKKLDIALAGPCHCSGEEGINLFKKEYGDNFIEIKAGQTIEI